MDSRPTVSSFITRRSLWYLVIGVSVWAIFGPTLGFDFLSWDDDQNVINNRWLHPGQWQQFWFKPYLCMYLPPVYSAWYLLATLKSPLDPLLFHALNVAIHMVNAILVFQLATACLTIITNKPNQITTSSPNQHNFAAAFAGMAFALHPLQVESVAWITGLRDMLSATGSLTATLLFLKANGSHKKLLIAWLAFLFALLCKPSAVALPAAIVGLTWGGTLLPAATSLRKTFPWFMTCLPIIYITKAAQTEIADRELLQLSFWQKILIAFDSYYFYLSKWLLPFGLINDYGRKPFVALADPWLPLSVILIITICVALWLLRKRLGATVLGWILFAAIAVAPVSGIVSFPFQHTSTVTDHYLYLSLAALSVALSLTVWKLKPAFAAPISIGLLTLWTVIDLRQLQVWRSDKNLFPAMIAANPRSYAGLTGMAALAMREKKREEALTYIIAAQKIDPQKVDLLANKGLVLNELGRYEDVLSELGATLPARQIVIDSPVSAPSVAVYYMMLAYANIKLQRIAESVPHLCMAQWADATNKDVMGFMPLVLKHLGRDPNDISVCTPFIK